MPCASASAVNYAILSSMQTHTHTVVRVHRHLFSLHFPFYAYYPCQSCHCTRARKWLCGCPRLVAARGCVIGRKRLPRATTVPHIYRTCTIGRRDIIMRIITPPCSTKSLNSSPSHCPNNYTYHLARASIIETTKTHLHTIPAPYVQV